ncbi:hypothetical protein TGCAST_211340 [Toxoplasma gondii CAST]|uniref:Uncharacterized protein n=1 Tax=Toxoplasma gondii CAST TaxID=943122 RepID=A0A3R8AHU6_TOXGO|nr:hypothetical protein TGCAST_211340 [Toxoplasma gondii CAST]
MAQETATLGVFAEWLCSAIETVLSSRLSAPSSSLMSSASTVFEPPLLRSSSSNPPVAAHGFYPTSSVRTSASSAPPLFGIPCSPRIPSLRNALFAAAPELQSFPSCPPFSISVDVLLFLPFSTVGTCGLLPQVLPLLMPFSGDPLTLASTSDAPPTDRSFLSCTTSSVSRSSRGVTLPQKTHEATQEEEDESSGVNGDLISDSRRNFQHNDYQSRDTFRDDKTREGSHREANAGKSEREDEDRIEQDSRETRDATIRPALFYSTREPHETVDGECTAQKADMRDRQHRDGDDYLPGGESPPVFVSPFFFACHASHGRKCEDASAGRSRGSDGGRGRPLTPSSSGISRLGDERSVTTASSQSHHDNANDNLVCLLLERWTFAYSPPLACASPPSWSPSGPSAALGGQSFDILLRNLSTAMRGFTAFAHLLPTFSLLSSAESLLFPPETDAGFNALSVPSMYIYPARHQTPIYRYPKTQLQADETRRTAFHREDREAAQKSTSRIPPASSTYQRSLHAFSHHVPIPKSSSLSTAFLAAAPSLSSSPMKTSRAEPRCHRPAPIPSLSLPATCRSTAHSFLSSSCHPSRTHQGLRPFSATSSLSSSSPRRPFGPAELSACHREATSPSLASTASQTSFSGSLSSSCLHGLRCSRSPRDASGPAPPWCMHASIFLHWDGAPSSYRRRQSSRSSDVAVATYASHAHPLSCHQPSLASWTASARNSEGTTWEGFSESQMSPLETSLSSLSGGPRIVAALVPRCASPRDSLRQQQGERSTRGQKSGKREADASFRKPHCHRSDKRKKAVEKSTSKSMSACSSGSTQQTPRDRIGIGLGSAGTGDAGKRTWLTEEEAGYSQVPGVALPCGQGILSVRVSFREDIAFLLEPAAEACTGPGLVASSPDSSFGGSGRPEVRERRTSVLDGEADETERLGRCAPISSPTLSASGASGDFGGRSLFVVSQEGEDGRNMEKLAGLLADTGRKGNDCQGERDSQGDSQEAEGRMETDPTLRGEFHRGNEEEDERTCFRPPHETISTPRTNGSDAESPDTTRDLSAGASCFDSTPPPPMSLFASLPRKESTIHLSSSCAVAAETLRREVGDVSPSLTELFRCSEDACTLDSRRLPRAAARHAGAAPCRISIHLPFPGSMSLPSISPSSSASSLSPSASASPTPLPRTPEAGRGQDEERKDDARDEETTGDEANGTQRVQVTDASQQARSVCLDTNDEKGMQDHTHEEDSQTHAMKWVAPVSSSRPLVPREASWAVRASRVDFPFVSRFSVPSARSEARRSSPYIWKDREEGERGGEKGRGPGFEGTFTKREGKGATVAENEGRNDTTLGEGSSFVVADFASCRTMVRPSSSLVSFSSCFVPSDSCPPSEGTLTSSQNSAAETKTRWAVLLQRSPALEPSCAISADSSSSILPSSSTCLASSLCRSSASTSFAPLSVFLPPSSSFLASSSSSPFVSSTSPFCSSSSTFLSASRRLSSCPLRSPPSPALYPSPASTSAAHCTGFGVAKLPAELRLSTEERNLGSGIYSAKKEEGRSREFPGCGRDSRKLQAQGQEERAFWGADEEARGSGTLERLKTLETHRAVIVLDFDLEEDSDGDQDFWEAGADVVRVGRERADGELHLHPLLTDLTDDISVESNALRASVQRRRSSPKKRGSVRGFPADVTESGDPFEVTPSREKALSCPRGVTACAENEDTGNAFDAARGESRTESTTHRRAGTLLACQTDKSDDGDEGDSSFLALWLMPELSAPSYAASQRLRAGTAFAEAGEIQSEGESEEMQMEIVRGKPAPHPFTLLRSIKEVCDSPDSSSDLQVSSRCLSSAATPFSISAFLEEAASPPLGWLADAWRDTLEAFHLSASEPISLCNFSFSCLVEDLASPPSRRLTENDGPHSSSVCFSPSGPYEKPKAPKLRGSPDSPPSSPDSDDAFFSSSISCSLHAESTSSRLKTPSLASWRRHSSGSSHEDQRKRAASSHQRPSRRQTAGEQEMAGIQVVGKASKTSAETKCAGEAEKRNPCEGKGTKAIEGGGISNEIAGELKCHSREGQKKSGEASLHLVSQLVDLLHAADEASEADVSACSSFAVLSYAARPSPPSLVPPLSLSHVSSALLPPSFGTQRTGAGDAAACEGKEVLDSPFFHGAAQRRHEGERETRSEKPDEAMKGYMRETATKRGEKTSEAREQKGDRIKCGSNLGTGANLGGRRTSEEVWTAHQLRRLDKQLNAYAEFSHENQRRIAFPYAF